MCPQPYPVQLPHPFHHMSPQIQAKICISWDSIPSIYREKGSVWERMLLQSKDKPEFFLPSLSSNSALAFAPIPTGYRPAFSSKPFLTVSKTQS